MLANALDPMNVTLSGSNTFVRSVDSNADALIQMIVGIWNVDARQIGVIKSVLTDCRHSCGDIHASQVPIRKHRSTQCCH